MIERAYIFLVFAGVICGVFALGAYIADNFLQGPPEKPYK